MTCYEYEGTRYVKGRHFAECAGEGDCSGCLRCPEAHCEHCRKGTHVGFGEATCPECIGKARAALRAILELYAALPDEAEVQGVASEAFGLHGPVADAEALSHRRVSILAGRINAPLPEEDEHHPLSVLGRWVFMLGEDYGDEWTGELTLSGAVDYLDRRLGRVAHDVGQDFGQFKREVGRCRAHLEAVLHDGEQRDTGAPCMTCDIPLVREWGQLVAADGWRCPKCKEFRTEEDYRRNVAQLHARNATHLSAQAMGVRTGVKPGTLRAWASRDLIRSRVEAGRVVYSVAEVEARIGRIEAAS